MNSNVLAILFVLIALASCKNDKELGKTQVYEDGGCVLETLRAKYDCQKGKLVYSIYSQFDSKYLYKEEITELLNQNGIEYQPLSENCSGDQNCYGKFMYVVIQNKFGKSFIDSIITQAHILSDSKYKTKIYNIDLVDSVATNLVLTESKISLSHYLIKHLKIPSLWNKSYFKESLQSISFDFVINSSGNLLWVEKSFKLNSKEDNKQFVLDFKNQISYLLKKLGKWTPAKLNNHDVNSFETVYLELP